MSSAPEGPSPLLAALTAPRSPSTGGLRDLGPSSRRFLASEPTEWCLAGFGRCPPLAGRDGNALSTDRVRLKVQVGKGLTRQDALCVFHLFSPPTPLLFLIPA